MPRRRAAGKRDDFAAAVLHAYKRALGLIADKHPSDDDHDVREAAFGLAAIRQLLNEKVDQIKQKPFDSDALTATGIANALALFDSLTTGKDHPIQRYISGLKSRRFRSNAAPPNELVNLGRAIIVATMRLLQETGSSQTSAAQLVCDCLDGGHQLTINKVKGWDRTFRETEHAMPLAAMNDLRQASERKDPALSLQDRILQSAQDMLARFWVTPQFPPVLGKSPHSIPKNNDPSSTASTVTEDANRWTISAKARLVH